MRYSDLLKFSLPRRRQRYQEVFGTPDGQWVLADLAKRCGLGDDLFVKGDSHSTAYMVGRVWPVLDILATINMSEQEIAERIRAQEENERKEQEFAFS